MQPSTTNAGMQQTGEHYSGTKKTPFSCICSLVMPEQKQTIFARDIPLG